MKYNLFALGLMITCLAIKAEETEREDFHLSSGNITLLDYEADTLEPWQGALEISDSRETLPSVRREKRSVPAVRHDLLGVRKHTRSGKRSHRRSLLDRRVYLSAVGRRHKRGPLDRLLKLFQGDSDDEPSETETEYNNLNEKIFVLPSSYLVPDSVAQPFCLRHAGLWSDKVEEALKTCTKATDNWSCTYLKMGRKSKTSKFSMSDLSKWLRSSSSGPKSLHKQLSEVPDTCAAFWKRYVREEKRRLFLSELEHEVERRTADLAGHRWRRDPEQLDDSQWAEIDRLRRQKLNEMKERREKTKRLKDLKSREETLTTEERGELMRLKDVIGEVGERERETLLGSNLEREEQVLRQEADVLASCLAQGVLKACEETLMATVRKSLQ